MAGSREGVDEDEVVLKMRMVDDPDAVMTVCGVGAIEKMSVA